MRIRLFEAFASNNSGSYTIVGRFREASTAQEVADALRSVIEAHDAWCRRPDGERGKAPLGEFARARGLAGHDDAGTHDDWPEDYSSAPGVVAVGDQVVVHAAYTVTMPRLFGAFFFARGGRVDVELDHAHHHTVVVFEFWPPWSWRQANGVEAANAELARLRDALLAGPLREHTVADVAPAVVAGPWSNLRIGAVFDDLVAGVAAVRATLEGSPFELRLTLHEALVGDADPLAALRGEPRVPEGGHQLVLWRVGADAVAVLQAVQHLRGGDLAANRALLADAPCEVLAGVNRHDAEAGAAALRAAGAEVEVLMPDVKRPR